MLYAMHNLKTKALIKPQDCLDKIRILYTIFHAWLEKLIYRFARGRGVATNIWDKFNSLLGYTGTFELILVSGSFNIAEICVFIHTDGHCLIHTENDYEQEYIHF